MDVKQVIVVRKDLKMRRGKEIAQGAHASSSFLLHNRGKKLPPVVDEWIESGHTKVCLQVESEEEIDFLYQKALEAGLFSFKITDSGKTEFNGVPTVTCLAIGPNYSEEIDKITKDLKLY